MGDPRRTSAGRLSLPDRDAQKKVILPLILAYTAWIYWVFRGKIDEEAGYHH